MSDPIYCRWLVRFDRNDVIETWIKAGLLVPSAVFSFRASAYEQFTLKLSYDDLRVRPDKTPLPQLTVLNPRSGKNISVANTFVKQHSLCLRNFLNGNEVKVIESSVLADFVGTDGAWRRAYCRSIYNWLLKSARPEHIMLVGSDLSHLFTADMRLEEFAEHDLLTRHALR